MTKYNFSEEIRVAIKESLLVNDLAVQDYLDSYATVYDRVGQSLGAPDPKDLKATDVTAVVNVESMNSLDGESWQSFFERITDRESLREDVKNPWMPNWISKTEDRISIWLGDCGQTGGSTLPEEFRKAVTTHLRSCTPYRHTSNALELVGSAPINDPDTMIAIAHRIGDMKKIMIEGLGESSENPEFRWSRAVSMLAGLGFDAFRVIAYHMRHADETWDAWSTASDDELREDFLKCREICGYPISLLRADFKTLMHISTQANLEPRWLKQLFLIHLLKHVRFVEKYDDKPWLHIAYRGERALIPLTKEALNQSIGDPANLLTKQIMLDHLGVTIPDSNLGGAMNDVLSKLHPVSFLPTIETSKRIDILAFRGVKFATEFVLKSDHRWIDPGIEVQDVARIDLNSGKVDKDACITGADAINLRWPFKLMKSSERDQWLSSIPDVVEPRLPSEIIKEKILNVNTLGHSDGFWAMLDGLIIADLIRDEVHGTEVGGVLVKEFPLVFVFPIGHEVETTTNQGKTSLARLLANTLVPELEIDISQKTTSAPAQRTMSMNMGNYGTALFDEFVLPQAHDHLLSQGNLQSLSTGSGGGPGRAGENAEPIKLRHPLFFTAKMCDFPPDIRNRTFPCFMDAINDSNRLNPKQLTDLMAGRVAPIVRLSALMWIKKNNIIARVRDIKELLQGYGRFIAHSSIISLFCDNMDDVRGYFEAAEKQYAEQLRGAEESGLAENIGATMSFDPAYYFQQMSDGSVKIMSDQLKEEAVSPLEALTRIVSDGQRRTLPQVLQSFRCREATAVRAFKKAINEGRMHRPGWEMKLVQRKSGRGRPIDVVVIDDVAAREKVSEPIKA